MSLNYRIHWIDDDKHYPNSLLDNLKIEFNERIVFEVDFAVDGAEIENLVNSEHLDLVILDYNLEGNQSGDEIINRLRKTGELTEIVFYSADPDVHKKCSEINGVHVCVRDDAEDEINKVLNNFIERNSNVAVMRGMIISEAIDVENKLTEILIGLFGDKADLFRRRILNKPLLDFTKKHGFLSGVVNELLAKKRSETPVDSDLVEQLENLKGILKTMPKEIVSQRNILAHSEKSVVDGVLTLSSLNSDPPIKFDDAWKNQIRSNIKKHLKNLAEIRLVLTEAELV